MEKKMYRLILVFILIAGLLCGCGNSNIPLTEPTVSYNIDQLSASLDRDATTEASYRLRAAVLYSQGESWQDTLYYLEQAPILGLEAEAVNTKELSSLDQYQILYLDESLLLSPPEGFTQTIEAYTKKGGAVFLPNGFCQVFSKDFLGISSVLKIDGFPDPISYPECKGDERALQQVFRDYAELYVEFADFQEIKNRDYGYAFLPQDALPLVLWKDAALYSLNSFGDGYVFLTNPLLPNAYSTGTLTMEIPEGASTFASTTASFQRLALSAFAQYVAKQHYGYALERSYGYFGTPSMAWELHYEEITGFAHNSMKLFSELCKEYDQIPSFTLIRNSYTWFLRAESVTYLLSNSENEHSYAMDLYENAYSSGTHIDSGGSWLTLAEQEDAGSYFADYPEYTIRAYPQVADLDMDGNLDVISGSSDGKIYFFRGKGYYADRLHTYKGNPLTDSQGQEISCGKDSAPQVTDLNGDSQPDLICVQADGTISQYLGSKEGHFTLDRSLLKSDIRGQVLPAVGDLNQDGITDLVTGSDQGILIVYYGEKDSDGSIFYEHTNATNLSRVCADTDMGKWLAPTVVDWNMDGKADLAVGVFHGYIALLLAQEDGSYQFSGYITAEEMNYKGNHNLKFGNWAVPDFADLNGDGKEDLVCGSQEYGIAYPIDSEYFPLRKELQEQIDYAEENGYYVGVHFYTNAYASAQREQYELAAHRKAMESYGMDTSKMGANQHTWYTSTHSGSQSMASIYDAGLYWQSGFSAPGSKATAPQIAAENVVSLPFYLMKDGSRSTLVQNNATLMYKSEDWNKLSARYGMPVCIYYHCDFAYESHEPSHRSLEAVQSFRESYGYNFNREDQLMLASAAALHQKVELSGSMEDAKGLTIALCEPSQEYDLYREEVYNSLGAKLIFSNRYDAKDFSIDADIWYQEDNTLIFGLNRPVHISKGASSQGSHLRRINMAAKLLPEDKAVEVQFLSGGMMELSVEGHATTDSPGWKVIHREKETIFIKFGSQESLHVIF